MGNAKKQATEVTAHTPGPLVDGQLTVAGEWDFAGDGSVTRPLFFDDGRGQPDGAAGYEVLPGRIAPLLAAAPRLLAALELVVALSDHPEARCPGYGRLGGGLDAEDAALLDPQALRQIRAAIAKARGAQ